MGEVGSCPSRDQRAGSIGPWKLRAGTAWQSKAAKTRRDVQKQLKNDPERAEPLRLLLSPTSPSVAIVLYGIHVRGWSALG